ncbi:MAG: DUF4831 family protein [Alistipes sp.]|nr:DUF4831 family protein [Alistipes sp.]
MKRQLFLMAIMAICSATTLMAQGIVRTGIYMQDGTMHFVRPTTDLHVKLTVEHSQFVPGEYARYAQSMLGVRASLAARSSAKITEVSIEQGKAMAVVPCADSDEGASVAKELPTYRLDNRSMTVEQQAQSAADMIFALRRHRKELITGEAGENVFGAGLRSALDEIDRMENECLSLFFGTTKHSVKHYVYPITPRSEEMCYMICRFRDDAGILPMEDLSGDAIMLTIAPAAVDLMGARIATEKDKIKADYAFPAECKCTLTCGTTIIDEEQISIYQYGKVATIVPVQ